MRVGLVQICASDDPMANLPQTQGYINDAAKKGAGFILTPEVTNCVSTSRSRQSAVLHSQKDDPTLAALREQAAELGIWLLIGSLALKLPGDARFTNRSFLISPDGAIAAQYDKIHMFDVTLSDTETYRESAGYRPGEQAVLAQSDFGKIGMTICYDLRFPALYRKLAQAGASILTIPAAFARPTGKAHWEVLLRARAIETGCFVLAPAQTGDHPQQSGRTRSTYGHSMVIDPWGDILLNGGTDTGVYIADIDLSKSDEARRRVPSLSHDRKFNGPNE